jgi:hypothetical protein
MTEENFADFVARERQRLHAERERIFNQQHDLQIKLDEIHREFAAIDAYEAAKTGKPISQPAAARGRMRARRGSKREQVLDLIRQHPDGLARKDILDRMGLKGDRSGEMSVSNALTALIKANHVMRREGRYVAPA